MPTVFWFSKLKPDVQPEDYESWARTVDYVQAKKIPSILSYRIYRLNGKYTDEQALSYDYLEIVEVKSIEEYRADIGQHPAAQVIIAEIGNYIDSVGDAWGTLIEA